MNAHFVSLDEFDTFHEGLKASVRADPELPEEQRARRCNYLSDLHFHESQRQGFFRRLSSVHVENATTSGSAKLKREETT